MRAGDSAPSSFLLMKCLLRLARDLKARQDQKALLDIRWIRRSSTRNEPVVYSATAVLAPPTRMPASIDALPVEIILEVWSFDAADAHNVACPYEHKCHEYEFCPENRSPSHAFPFVSQRWNRIAKSDPTLWTYIRVSVHTDFNQDRNFNTVLVDNVEEIRACTELSSGKDVYISIGCFSGGPPPPGSPSPWTVRAVADRTISLCFDSDNSRLVFMVDSAHFPKLRHIHLGLGRQDNHFSHSSRTLEELNLWRTSPIQSIVWSHHMGKAGRAPIRWEALTLMDLHGAYLGYPGAEVEDILSKAGNLEELRIAIDGKRLDVPDLVRGRHAEKLPKKLLIHRRLKVLYIEQRMSHRPHPPSTPKLFQDMKFTALEKVHYHCDWVPHDNHVAWLMEGRPTVTYLEITTDHFTPSVLLSIVLAFPHLETLHLKHLGARYRPDPLNIYPMDDAKLKVLQYASRDLRVLVFMGECCFTPEAVGRFGTHFPSDNSLNTEVHTVLSGRP